MTFIKGETCELRVLEESDYEIATWQKSVMAGLTTQHLFTGSFPMRAIDVRAKWKSEREGGDVLFGIWTLKNGSKHADRFIGTCGLHGHRSIYRSWELRILIHDPDALGWGIGTEATTMLVNYGFTRLNAHRIWLGCSADNEAAWKCYERVGFKKEGVLRDEIYYGGRYHDALRYGLLETEWRVLIAPDITSGHITSDPGSALHG